MRNLLNPRWIFVVNTLPVVILFILFTGEFNIIKSLLNPENISLWMNFGMVLGFLTLINILYALYSMFKGKKVHILYSILALVAYITFLYVYMHNYSDIIPFSVPRWMISDELMAYMGSFLMPTLIYSLLILIVKLTPEEKNHKAWKSFVIAVAIPLVVYIFSQIIQPLWRLLDNKFFSHIISIISISITLAFLFFLIRSVYILGLKKTEILRKYQLAWKIPISIIFPLAGLAINDGDFLNFSGNEGSGFFGNFSNIWFPILALVNGIFICLPNLGNKIYRIILYIARGLTFAYTLYFFLVFLPFLPLSVVAIIAFGAGFLMLTPLILFVIHVNELSNDYKFIKSNYSSTLAIVLPAIAFLVIPLIVTLKYKHDKAVLGEALEYVYSPDFTREYSIDKKSLNTTMNELKYNQTDNRGMIFGNSTPFLTEWYKWIVLDNMILSTSKYNRIENVFFGTGIDSNQAFIERSDTVQISDIQSTSKFDQQQNAWISQVDIELTNKNNLTWRQAEYFTKIALPEGCFISNYYLYVGDKKEMGILAEKKASMWVYQQITSTNRDPGILYYLNSNTIGFRVFPFAHKEIRKTGIEFIHKEPVEFYIDSILVKLGNYQEQNKVSVNEENSDVIYLSASEKMKLPLVKREPFYHFIIDVSKDEKNGISTNINRIENFLKTGTNSSKGAKFSFVGTYTTTCSANDDWKSVYNGQHFDGGFFLDRAIKSIIVETYKSKSMAFPVLIVVSNNINKAIVDDNFSLYNGFYPESDYFFELDSAGKLLAHSLSSEIFRPLSDTLKLNISDSVRVFPNLQKPLVYLPNNNKASVIVKKDDFEIDENQIKAKNWQSALLMQGKYLSLALHPEKAGKDWLKLVKYSFKSEIMNPYTSYIVVENEAQKAILKKKQEQVLSGNHLLDLSEDITRMSEPGLIVMIILTGLFLWFQYRRN